MKSIFYAFHACLFILLICSCSQENDNEIEAELQIHFDSFVEEANTFGMEISLDDLDIGGYVENIEQRGTLGQCKSFSDGSKHIVVDESYWNRIDATEREYLVFHELGHCVLGREHLDTSDASGICTSIMQSGDGDCRGIYNLTNREELLKELFEH